MRKMVFCLSLVAVFTVGVLLLPKPKLAQPDDKPPDFAAVVGNHGICTVDLWSGEVLTSEYNGKSTEVATPSGVWTDTCEAELTFGTRVNRTMQLGGTCSGDSGSGLAHVVVNPGGHAHVNCYGSTD